MTENRWWKYGRNLAILVSYVVNNMPEKDDYKKRLIDEIKTYSFQPRKKGSPVNWGCKNELFDISEVNVKNPEELAKLLKESIHLMYQKFTAKRVLDALLWTLEKSE